MEIDKDTLEKQRLLKEEIVDKEYDRDRFIDFCLHKKEHGDDISKWSVKELTSLIKEFQSLVERIKNSEVTDKEKDIEKDKDITKAKLEKISEKKDINDEKISAITLDIEQIKEIKTTIGDEKFLNSEIICKKLEKTILNDVQLEVKLNDPQIVEGGFFSSNFILYEVLTVNFEFSVRRRYSDFEVLRSILVKLFPGHHVPPLPSKKIGGRRFEEDYVLKRMLFLQNFIQNIVRVEDFKASSAVFTFLAEKERNKYDAIFNELNNSPAPTLVEDYLSLEGKVKMLIDEEMEKPFNSIKEYTSLSITILERMNNSFRFYNEYMNQAIESLDNIAYDLELMYKLNKKVSMKEGITKTYKEISLFLKSCNKIYNKQKSFFNDHIKQFYKYTRMEHESFQELLRSREVSKDKYNAELLKLNIKKEKLWINGDTNKWDMSESDMKIDRITLMKDKNASLKKMLVKDSLNAFNLQKNYGYISQRCLDELKQKNSCEVERIKDNLNKFIDNYYTTITDGVNNWTNMASNISLIA